MKVDWIKFKHKSAENKEYRVKRKCASNGKKIRSREQRTTIFNTEMKNNTVPQNILLLERLDSRS
jgi:hypothetical protein